MLICRMLSWQTEVLGLAIPEPMKGKSEKERNRVCDYYDSWFHEAEQIISGYQDAVLRTFIDAKYIGCWCAPKRCHVDTIIEFIKAVKGVGD